MQTTSPEEEEKEDKTLYFYYMRATDFRDGDTVCFLWMRTEFKNVRKLFAVLKRHSTVHQNLVWQLSKQLWRILYQSTRPAGNCLTSAYLQWRDHSFHNAYNDTAVMTVSEWLAVTSGSLLFEFWPHVDYPELITSSWFSLVYSGKKCWILQ